MSKAVLKSDMPKSCDMCNFADMVNGKMYCGVPGCGELAEDYIMCRPDWCPLRELPEKREVSKYMNEKEKGYCEGWNACIDAMTGGEY